MKGLFRMIVTLVIATVAAYGGWRWGDAVFPALESRLGLGSGRVWEVASEGVSAELARDAMRKLERLADRGRGEELALSADEVTSVLRFEIVDRLPVGVFDPTIGFEHGELGVRVSLMLDSIPGFPSLGGISDMLPDTVSLAFRASLMASEPGRAAAIVRGVEASRIPLPGRLVPDILNSLGRTELPGLPDDAIRITLPEGVRSIYVRGDSLVLVAEN